jgi:hypothetical protein
MIKQSGSRARWEVWHRRLGHLASDSMRTLFGRLSTGGAISRSTTKPEVCEGYAVEKIIRPPFQANLELKPSWTLFTPISADRWAFAQKEEPQHLMVLVDDRSRYTWAYFLKINPEALGCTKDWMIKVVRFTERKVKFDRSGNGESTPARSLRIIFARSGLNTRRLFPSPPKRMA